MSTPLQRSIGCLVGLATGDALGTTLEFSRPGSFTPLTDMIGGGPFSLKSGQWTDDTSMALCLAVSLLENGFDPVDQCERYVRWWRDGYYSSTGECFDIGNTVQSALRRFMREGNSFSGNTSPDTAGNGSIMRLAPVPIYYAHNADQAIHMAGESSRTTHQAPAAIDACRYMAGILVGLIQGESKETVLSSYYRPNGRWQAGELDPAIHQIAAGSFKEKHPPEIIGSGYVVRCLEAALWAFYHTNEFETGALKAVNLGNDADTTGAVYGQMAGACYGIEGIPTHWRKTLHQYGLIRDLAEELFETDLPHQQAAHRI